MIFIWIAPNRHATHISIDENVGSKTILAVFVFCCGANDEVARDEEASITGYTD
jgi:hypothetical protein